MIPTAVPWGNFFAVFLFVFGTKYYANFEIMTCQVLISRVSFVQALQT